MMTAGSMSLALAGQFARPVIDNPLLWNSLMLNIQPRCCRSNMQPCH